MRWLSCAVAAGVVCAALPAATASRTGSVAPVVRITPRAAVSAPQGAPFAFRAGVTNPGAAAAKLDVSLAVGPERGGRVVTFRRDALVVPSHGTVVVEAAVTSAQWFPGRGTFRIEAKVDGTRVGAPLLFTVGKPRVAVPVFEDATAAAGLATTLPDGSCGHWTNGAAWGDVDGNGFPDLYVTRGTQPAQLFLNDGRGRFRERGAALGVATTGAYGAVFADYDGDERPDLHVLRDGPDHLYRNAGGRFVDVAGQAGLADPANGASATWGDYDDDGRLDVYVVNYARCQGETVSGGLEYAVSRLYHNDGHGRFSDRTDVLGSHLGAGFQAAWFDANADGRPDLYLGNDYLGQRPDANYLWRNDGPGPDGRWQFADATKESGTFFAMNTMGIAVADYNRDGSLDFALSNIESNRLLRGFGNGAFVDVARDAGVARPQQRVNQKSVTWGAVFGDLNVDGWEDLYFAAGALVDYATGLSKDPQRNELFVNGGAELFDDLSAPSGADDPGQSRGVAVADYDRDGRLDLFVVNQKGSPRLLRNVTPLAGRHWLEVRTVGTRSNRDGCGARLTLTAEGRPQLREVLCGSQSISSGCDTVVHFGLGSARRVARLEIEWPSGRRQVLRELAPDRLLTVREPGR